MKLRTRRRIFYVFLLLFVVIGTVVVLYAEGWRIDVTTMAIKKAGGIYIRSYPDNAAITLNGVPVQNQSGFLSPGTFISGLFPKQYRIILSAPGYDRWTENAPVVPSLVTAMKYAVLVPQNAATTTAVGASDFFEANGDVVMQTATGTILWRGTRIGSGAIVSHSTDLKNVIIRGATFGNGLAPYTLYDFTNSTSTALVPLLRSAGIIPLPMLNVFIDPYDDTGIIVQTSAKIVRIDAGTHHLTPIDAAPAGQTIESPIAISPTTMAWARFDPASDTSEIMVYDKFSGDLIDSSLTVPGIIRQLAWVNANKLGILESDNTLSLYDVPNERLSTLADDVKQFFPAPDGTAIAALEYHSMEVFVPNGTPDYYRFPLPAIGDILGLTWYRDDTHLFVRYPDRIAFLDLADTMLLNFTTVSPVAPGSTPVYDPQENSLYLIDQDHRIIRFDFPQ